MNFAKPPVSSASLLNVSSVPGLVPALGETSTALINPPLQSFQQGASGASAIAFIDANVSDYQTLLAGVTPGTEVHVLDSSQDAVTQITNTLLGRSNISSLHIVSHGEAGGLDFGTGKLNLSDLPEYAAQLQSWSNALTADADILLYGCNVAEGELGKAFTNILSQLTGADVAASNNLTGKNGDWNLEVTTGKIESSLVFSSSVTAAYAYDLDNILGETFRGSDVTNPAWIYNTTGTQPFLTARSTTAASTGGIPGGGGDTVGSGALRLTSAATGQASFVIYNRPINASSGLSITFNIHAYGGSGADGISFFLIDGNASPTASGAPGGSLGYAANTSGAAGLVGGYLGIGFDEFGNFSAPESGPNSPGARADSIAVRGRQASNYQYLAGTGTLAPGIDVIEGTRSAAQKKVQLDLTPAGVLSVKIDLNNDGVFSGSNEIPAALQNYNVTANNGALPSTFKFGFSASTGGSTNVHEITGLDVITFNNTPYVPLVNFTSSSASVSEGAASLNLTAQIDVATSNTVTVPVTLSGTAVNGTDYTLSNNVITILPGQLTGSITLNPVNDSLVEPNETAVVTMGTPTGATLSPQNNVFTATIIDDDYSVAATGSPTYVENASPIVIAPTTTITGDLTASTITSATVSIGSGFSSAEDRLGIQGQSGTSGTIASTSITWSYNTTSGVLTLSGTATGANYEAALRQVVYSDLSDTPSATNRTIAYGIQYGSGGQATSSTSPTISVTAVNDAPTVTAPTAIAVTEDTTTTLTGISFADVDAGSSTVTATLTVGAGTLAATSGGGVTVGGTATNLTLGGTITAINSFIAGNGLTYTTALNATTAQTLGVSLNDGGNTGSGGAQTSTLANVTLNVTAVNDAPTVTAPGTITTPEDVATPLTGIAFADVDAGSGSVIATFTVGAGTLAATSGSGVTVGGTATNRTLSGTITAINSFLAGNGLTYTTALNATTAQTLGVSLNDGGNTGSGGALASAVSTVALNVTAVNDAPSLTGNATLSAVTQYTTDSSGSSLTSLFGSLFSDPDTGDSLSGLAIVGNAANSSTQGQWQYSIDGTTWASVGTVTDGATALALSASTLVRFVPVLGFVGTPPSLTVRALDSTYSGTFSTNTTLASVNTTSNGGTTAIAGTTVTLDTSVTKGSPNNLLWRNGSLDSVQTGTGENAVWRLNNFTLQSGYYIPTVTDLNWQIITTADFNRDGNADILWRNRVSGANVIWQMNSKTFQSGYFIPTVADLNWQIITTADFNRDGTPDIVWRNRATGENAIWQMNGFSLQSASYVTTVADLNWQIVGAADFNGDGAADLLWRNKATSQNGIWRMNGATTQTTYYIGSTSGTNWQVAGTADFNGDGTSDIVWRNQATGENALWQMNSTGLQSGYYLPTTADLNWQIAGVADFGGDTTPDILWRNQTAGKVGIWELSGFSYVQAHQLPDVPRDWTVRPYAAPV